jgi:hypothetical protein
MCTIPCLISETETGDVKVGKRRKRRLFRRKDQKYLIYLPKDLAEDSMFPFKGAESIFVKVSFKLKDDKLLVERWVAPEPEQPEE